MKSRLLLAAFSLLWLVPLNADEHSSPESPGFIGDTEVYAKLEPVEVDGEDAGKRWIGPDLNLGNYRQVLIDDVVFYPEAEPGPQVSAETLQEISDFLSRRLREKIGATITLAEAPGPGVLHMQTAVTGVAIETEGIKAYEVLPVAAVFGGIKAVAGKRDRNVLVFLEARFLDSQSGELVGAAMRRVRGEDLQGKEDQLTLDDLRENLEQITDDAQDVLSTSLEDGDV